MLPFWLSTRSGFSKWWSLLEQFFSMYSIYLCILFCIVSKLSVNLNVVTSPQPAIIPKVSHEGDTSNFDVYPEDDWKKDPPMPQKDLEIFKNFWALSKAYLSMEYPHLLLLHRLLLLKLPAVSCCDRLLFIFLFICVMSTLLVFVFLSQFNFSFSEPSNIMQKSGSIETKWLFRI